MASKRFWIIVGICGLALLGGKFSCRTISQEGRRRKLEGVEQTLKRVSSHLDLKLKQELQTSLNVAFALLDDQQLSPIAIDTLRQRCEATTADDEFTPREAAHLLALLRDFPAWKDEIHAVKYMGQR